MRRIAWCFGPSLLLLLIVSSTHAQRNPGDRAASRVATATPSMRVTTQNPREINLGKPATFVISVANDGKTPATGVIVATSIPADVDLARSDPKPLTIEGQVYKFRLGELAPGATRRVTLVTIPRTTNPIRLDTTVVFAASTRASVLVRRPMLELKAEAPPRVAIGDPVNWSVRISNVGDGPADDVVLNPSIVAGEIQGASFTQSIRVGLLKPGETKEIELSSVASRRGTLAAKFMGSNSDGLEASGNATVQILEAKLAVQAKGPQMQPMGRESTYEIHVTNPGDTATGSTMVTVKVPLGLDVTSAIQNAYHEATRTLRWRITAVPPSEVVTLRFRAESIAEGDQTLQVVAQTERIPAATTSYTTSVISRPNLIVTVINEQELSAIGEPIRFRVNVVNAGSKQADDLQIRVAVPEQLDVIESNTFRVRGGQIEFPSQKLDSGEKATLVFQVMGREVGDHRIQVLVQTVALTRALTFEGAAFCYADVEATTRRTAQGRSRRRAAVNPDTAPVLRSR